MHHNDDHIDYRDQPLPPGVAALLVQPDVSHPRRIIIRSTTATPAQVTAALAMLDATPTP